MVEIIIGSAFDLLIFRAADGIVIRAAERNVFPTAVAVGRANRVVVTDSSRG